nr:hypothetical protein [Geodermatophilaceae bacterium]
ASDWSVLAFWALVPDTGWIALNRPLRVNEEIWVTVEAGCVPAHLLMSDRILVEGAGDVDDLRIDEPLRPGASRSVWIRDSIPGGRVHVYVNQKWRASAWSIASPTEGVFPVFVGELTEESEVSARQTLCGRNGELAPPVWVSRGRMDLEAEPSSVISGQTVAMTIRGRDADHGFVMSGPVNGPTGFVGYLGQQFIVSAAAGTPSPIRFTVDTEGYEQGVVEVPISAPAPPPQAAFTITSISAIGVAHQVITDIEWTLTGGGQSIRRDQKPNTTTCVVTIPIPTPASGSTVVYNLSGKAAIEFIQPGTGAKLTQQATAFYTAYGLLGSIVVEWRGNARTAEINVAWAPIYDPETGAQIDTVYVLVLNTMS